MASLYITFSSLFFHALEWAGGSCNKRYSEYGFALVDHVYKSFFADRLVSCYMSCTTQPACQSLNYNLADKTCEFNNDTKYFRPKYFVEKPILEYGDNPSAGTFLLFHGILEIRLSFDLENSFNAQCITYLTLKRCVIWSAVFEIEWRYDPLTCFAI